MATRKIITINEDLCNGCGNCITGCAEGALQLVNGKAKLVKESFCDGFGDCIGTCPTGALKIAERESEEFDFDKTIEHVATLRGDEGVKQMRDSHAQHEQKTKPAASGQGCPGTRMRLMPKPAQAAPVVSGSMPVVMKSEITQWPLQLHLLQPHASFLNNREMVLLSTCAPVTSPDIHWRYVRGRSVAIACPKLDRTEGYVEKLAAILSKNFIPKLIILRMEVPCCGGLIHMVNEALQIAKPDGTVVEEVTMNIEGEIINTTKIYG